MTWRGMRERSSCLSKSPSSTLNGASVLGAPAGECENSLVCGTATATRFSGDFSLQGDNIQIVRDAIDRSREYRLSFRCVTYRDLAWPMRGDRTVKTLVKYLHESLGSPRTMRVGFAVLPALWPLRLHKQLFSTQTPIRFSFTN